MTRRVLLALLCLASACDSSTEGGDAATAADLAGEGDLASTGGDLSTGTGSDLGASGDLASPGGDLATGGDLGTAPDLAPSGPDCFYNWKTLGTCGAPVITESYLANDCVGTTGVFVIGHGFQSANEFDENNGFLEHGPYAIPTKLNRDSWNVVTPNMLCITTANDAGYWTNFTMQVRNPDGQLSNSVTVQNRLSARPPLPTTGSLDPWDRDACLDDRISGTEALGHFAPAASTAMLGTLTIQKRSRACNSATGCGAFGAASTVGSVVAGLAVAGGGSKIDFTLDGVDCGALDASTYTLSYNNCSINSGSYYVHTAAHCLYLMWNNVQRTTIAADGSYTETDYGGVVRY